MSQSQSPSLEPRTASSNCSRLLRSWRADSFCFLRLAQIIQKKAVKQARNEIRSRTSRTIAQRSLWRDLSSRF